jgi:hypothetical protein
MIMLASWKETPVMRMAVEASRRDWLVAPPVAAAERPAPMACTKMEMKSVPGEMC